MTKLSHRGKLLCRRCQSKNLNFPQAGKQNNETYLISSCVCHSSQLFVFQTILVQFHFHPSTSQSARDTRESRKSMDQFVQEKDHSLCNKDQISEQSISLCRFILSSYLGIELKSSKQGSSTHSV